MSQDFQLLKLEEKNNSMEELTDELYNGKIVLFNANDLHDFIKTIFTGDIILSDTQIIFGNDDFDINIFFDTFPDIDKPVHVEGHGNCFSVLSLIIKKFDLHLLTTDGEIYNSNTIE